MSKIEVGQIYEGIVTKIASYGVFVSLPEGNSGMIHISELTNGYVKDINEFVNVGDKLKVKVLSVEGKSKIALSSKQASENDEKPKQKRPKPKTFNGGFGETDNTPKSFEDMMATFMKRSDEKIQDLNRSNNIKIGTTKRKR